MADLLPGTAWPIWLCDVFAVAGIACLILAIAFMAIVMWDLHQQDKAEALSEREAAAHGRPLSSAITGTSTRKAPR